MLQSRDQETNRRLKNVLITIFWLGRRAQSDRFYDGPYLNFKAFEGLLGTALYKALQESSSQKGNNTRDSGFGESWYSEREELHQLRGEEDEEGGGGGGGGHRRDDSLDSLDSLDSRPLSISSDTTLKGSSEGCCSDTEVDSVFKMSENRDGISYRRSASITPKATTPFNQFLPTKDKQSGYVPAPLRKKRAERNDDNRRSWANPTYSEEEGPLTRQDQTQDSIEGSKSTSDIFDTTPVVRQARFEELQKYRQQIKESDDKWQDDLSKWKSRRRSVNSDIVKKKEEREKVEELTFSSSSNRRSMTFKEMQEERENKGKSVGSRLKSLSYLDDDEDVFEKPVATPRTRNLPARSYTIDTPLKEEEPRAASPAKGRAASPRVSREVDIVDSPAGRDSTTTTTTTATARSLRSSHSPADTPPQRSPVREYSSTVKTEKTTTVLPSSSSTPKAPEPRRPLLVTQSAVEAPSSGSLYKKQPQTSSMEPKPPGVSRVSASLPRSYQRSDSARLTSVVAPRPFGTQSSRITSLPRPFTVDESQKRLNGGADVSKKSTVPSRYHQFMTSEDEARSQSSSAHSSEDEDEEEEEEEESKAAPKSVTSTQSVTPVPPQVKSVSPVLPLFKREAPVSPPAAKETSQEDFCEMRISLNQKPNSSTDFGFQATWDSTGACVTSIQPGSPAEMCQLQLGDKVLAVNRHQVAGMSYTDWKSCMDEALQDGSLIMDIRRHGQNSSSDKNIVSPSLDFTSRISPEKMPSKETPTHQVIDVASNGVNGGFREELVTMRNKGGSESVMPDIPVPPITTPSSRWSWDPEEERRRQEKWQKEQERLLQEKYKRDQEKLQEEWLKSQEDITKSGDQRQPVSLEVNSHGIGPHSPLSPISHAVSPPWEEQERKRKEEQERQRQAEERRRREEEERELQRLQEERKRRERLEEEERKKMEEEELRWQRRKEEERELERRKQEALEQQRRERERAFEQQQQQQRAKSRSTPQLDEEEKPQRRVTGSGGLDKKGQPLSTHAELERQQILDEMKKKTPLLTDSSWIRQRSAEPSANKDQDMSSMRRGESLDNLDTTYNSWRSSWTPRSSSSIPNYSRPHSALSGVTNSYQGWSGSHRSGSSTLPSSYSMGSLRGGTGNPSAPWSRQSSSPSLSSLSPTTSPEPTSEAGGPQQRSRSVSGKKICTYCDTALGKGAAMIIESLGLCYHLGCFKCIDCHSELGGSEAGAEVRIRNKQLYCNSCYMRFKTGQPTAM